MIASLGAAGQNLVMATICAIYRLQSMFTWLRRIASCFFLVFCILFAVLWVRSYFTGDWIITTDLSREVRDLSSDFQVHDGRMFYQQRTVEDGKLDRLAQMTPELFPHTNYKYQKWLATSGSKRVSIPVPPKLEKFLGIGWHNSVARDGDEHFQFLLPLWLLVVAFGLAAAVLRPKPRWRFGLRDLFTLTTTAGVVVGPLAFWLRSISA